jgi:hypothetical protein
VEEEGGSQVRAATESFFGTIERRSESVVLAHPSRCLLRAGSAELLKTSKAPTKKQEARLEDLLLLASLPAASAMPFIAIIDTIQAHYVYVVCRFILIHHFFSKPTYSLARPDSNKR